MVYVGTCDCYENIKTLIYKQHIKTVTRRNFPLSKENDCKVQLRFVNFQARFVKYLEWLNDTGKTLLLNSVQEFIEIQAWLFQTFFLVT